MRLGFGEAGLLGITIVWIIVAYRIWVEKLPSWFPNGSITTLWLIWAGLTLAFRFGERKVIGEKAP